MSRKTILVVDDEKDIRDLLKLSLNRLGLDTLTAGNLADALEMVHSDQPLDFCLTDVRLPDGSGLEIVQQFRETRPETPIAVMTAFDSTDVAVEAMRAGAFDFLAKPIRHDRLKTMLENALTSRSAGVDPTPVGLLVGSSEPMQRLRADITKVARSLAPTLICGESGTGKELVARSIHQQSSRSSGPFVAVNCGAIPAELMESEFFGHTKGSFTGAVSDKRGLFLLAENGTLFLDGSADLPVHMQVKLLRALQEKTVRPIGGDHEIPTNVRIISATHKNLEEEVAAGRFRQDLYYRINVIRLEVPALRERIADLPELTQHILQHLQSEDSSALEIEAKAMDRLRQHPFPGNVRELENILHRAAALCEKAIIRVTDLGLEGRSHILPGMAAGEMDVDSLDIRDLEAYLQETERLILQRVMQEEGGNREAVAQRLNLSMRQLRYKLNKLDVNLMK